MHRCFKRRKAALGDATRYSILWYLTGHEDATWEELAAVVDGDDVEEHVAELIDAGLVARIGAPDGSEAAYRATHVGRQEIESDTENAKGSE